MFDKGKVRYLQAVSWGLRLSLWALLLTPSRVASKKQSQETLMSEHVDVDEGHEEQSMRDILGLMSSTCRDICLVGKVLQAGRTA